MKHLTITVPCFNSEAYLERCVRENILIMNCFLRPFLQMIVCIVAYQQIWSNTLPAPSFYLSQKRTVRVLLQPVMHHNLYQYYLGRDDQSVNEKVLISRIDQQIKVTKMVAESLLNHEIRSMHYPFMTMRSCNVLLKLIDFPRKPVTAHRGKLPQFPGKICKSAEFCVSQTIIQSRIAFFEIGPKLDMPFSRLLIPFG